MLKIPNFEPMDTSTVITIAIGASVSAIVAWVFRKLQAESNQEKEDIKRLFSKVSKITDEQQMLREKLLKVESDTDNNKQMLDQRISHIDKSIDELKQMIQTLLNK